MSATVETPHAAFDLTKAPMRIGRVRLRVRDGERVAAFYQRVLGLQRLGDDARGVRLGVAGKVLLELHADPGLAVASAKAAGLFHTAFLLPSRADLGRWLAHARKLGVRIDGAADHGVSEAIYLADPEGNGIEVYADRQPADWGMTDGWVAMPNLPLDVEGLSATPGDTAWAGAPSGTIVGHLHLKVGDTTEAERFYSDTIGFGVTFRLAQASFFGAGGYHHQLAANTWLSAGSGPVPEDTTGLAGFDLIVPDPAMQQAIERRAAAADLAPTRADDAVTFRDPWGVAITVRRT